MNLKCREGTEVRGQDYIRRLKGLLCRIDAPHLPMRVQSDKNGYWGQTSRGHGYVPYKEIKNFLLARVGSHYFTP